MIPVLVAHLSDPHLRAGAVGAEAATGLHRALGRLLSLRPQPDLIVITGDLADRGRTEEYEVLLDLVERFPLPVHLALGNHDDPASLAAVLGGRPDRPPGWPHRHVVEGTGFRLVVLDSDGRGRPAGSLGADQLRWLDATLAADRATPTLLAFHHPPIEVGIPVLDAQRLTDADALADVLADHPGTVVRILAGHVHRTVFGALDPTPVIVAPSTYRQSSLTLDADDQLGYVHEPPGFLLHRLDGDRCTTHVVPTLHAAAIVGHF